MEDARRVRLTYPTVSWLSRVPEKLFLSRANDRVKPRLNNLLLRGVGPRKRDQHARLQSRSCTKPSFTSYFVCVYIRFVPTGLG